VAAQQRRETDTMDRLCLLQLYFLRFADPRNNDSHLTLKRSSTGYPWTTTSVALSTP